MCTCVCLCVYVCIDDVYPLPGREPERIEAQTDILEVIRVESDELR